jgi:hypothetical protein
MKARYKLRSLIQDSLNLSKRLNVGLPQQFIYSLRDYLIDRVDDSEASVTYLAPPTDFEYSYPHCLADDGEPNVFTRLIDTIKYTQFPAWALVTIENAQLYSDSVLFTTPDGKSLFLDNGKHPGKTVPEVGSNALRKYSFRKIDKPAFLGFDRWASQYYYHWIADALPRFLALKEMDFDGVVLLPRGVADYMVESLAMIGVDETKYTFLEMEKRCKYQFSQLIYSQKRSVRNSTNPHALDQLHSSLLPPTPSKPESSTKARIYIPRNKAKTRKIVNEEELIGRLSILGFAPVYCETLTMEEKRELFSSAEFVVSSHGSGLTNILFCNPGAHVIEIVPENFMTEALTTDPLSDLLGRIQGFYK